MTMPDQQWFEGEHFIFKESVEIRYEFVQWTVNCYWWTINEPGWGWSWAMILQASPPHYYMLRAN
jgi:hypothetical protein